MQTIKSVTSRALKAGKVELTAHLEDGTSQVIARRVSDKPQVQFYSTEVNGNAEPGTLAAHFTIGKTIKAAFKDYYLLTFFVTPQAESTVGSFDWDSEKFETMMGGAL